jgi:quercetin dioxygenase-like cupin family protein
MEDLANNEVVDWNVRDIEDSPVQMLEGFKMHRVLDGSGFHGVGCEHVILEPHRVLDPHVHKKGHAFILVLDGHGYALIDQNKIKIKKNSMINIPPGTAHGLEAGDEPLVVYGFQVPGIIDENDEADIYFIEGNRRGKIVACT